MYRILDQESGEVHQVHCSRERSRTAWNIIEQVILNYELDLLGLLVE